MNKCPFKVGDKVVPKKTPHQYGGTSYDYYRSHMNMRKIIP